jgi:hypothetical protein
MKRQAIRGERITVSGWYIKKGSRWTSELLQTGDALWIAKDTRGPASDRKFLDFDKRVMGDWVGRSVCPEGGGLCRQAMVVVPCSDDVSEFEIGVEFKSKNGVGWSRLKLPFCVRPSLPEQRRQLEPASQLPDGLSYRGEPIMPKGN